MNISFLLDPRRAGVVAVVACLLLLSTCWWAGNDTTTGDNALYLSIVEARSQRRQCRKNQKDLAQALISYEQNYNTFPRQNGKQLITWLYLVGDIEKVKILQCPGSGASSDVVPKVDRLVFIRKGRSIEELEQSEFERDWPANTISYWGAAGDAENSDVESRYTLRSMLAPSDEDREAFQNINLSHDKSNIPLLSDDNDLPKNHRLGFNIGYADGSVRLIKEEWEESTYPFAVMRDK